MSPEYTYFLEDVRVYPKGEWELEIKKASEDFPFCKDYRIKFDGELIFTGDDYDLIKSFDCCDELKFNIYCDGVFYWAGYFSFPLDFEIYEDLCQVKGTPGSRDKYYYYDFYSDEEKEFSLTDTFTYQNNFPVAIPNDNWSVCIDCELLWDIITLIGSTSPLWPVGYTTNMKSTFFQNDLFPDGTNPYPVINYVTGLENKLKYVVLAMSIEVCSVGGTAGDLPEWSWDDLMEILHNEFNVWWYIDENGDVRIEHISFWELYFGVSYDLTTIDDGHWIERTSQYSYITEKLPKEELWELSENWNTFDPSGFTYFEDIPAKGGDYIKKYELGDLASDLEYIAPGINNLAISPVCADLSKSEYIFIRCKTFAEADALGYDVTACDYCAWFSKYYHDETNHLNAHLSSVNLLTDYWFYDRPYWEGHMLVGPLGFVVFESTERIMKQVKFSFPVCCDNELISLIEGEALQPVLYEFGINFNEFMKTQYGNGEVGTGTINFGNLITELLFENNCIPPNPFNIVSSCNVEFWFDGLDADTVHMVGVGVEQWDDKSGNNRHITQAVAGNRPTYNGGSGRLTFVRANVQYLSIAAFDAALAQPNTIYVVYKANNLANFQTVFSGVASCESFCIDSVGAHFEIHAGSSVNAGGGFDANDNIHCGEFNGRNSKYWINGVLRGWGDVGPDTLDGIMIGTDPLDIFGRASDVDIMEIFGFNCRLTTSEHAGMVRYIRKKWGINY